MPKRIPWFFTKRFSSLQFLYEHREEADYAGLLKRLRWLLFGVRRSCF